MVKVLKSWNDFGDAMSKVQSLAAGYHADPLKNWDIAQIGERCLRYPKTAEVLDVGCSENRCSVLRFLYMLGYRNLMGVDLRISLEDRAEQLFLMRRKRLYRPPFRLIEGDITSSKFKNASYDFIISLSVIEHGVDVFLFMKEISRLLRPGGTLYLSTDYWPQKIETGSVRPWGLGWTIYSENEIDSLIQIAQGHGLDIEDHHIPPVETPIVKWSGKSYTFISIIFEKR